MIHLVGLPHTQFNAETYSSCAFTAKAVRLAAMLRSVGREVTVYWGGTGSDVSLMSDDEMVHFFGEYSANNLPVVEWDARNDYWVSFNARAISEISKRIKPLDYVAVVGGAISQEVVNFFKPNYTCVEPGVGYEGICFDTFCCFESYAWMHHRYGAYGIGDGRSFDTVIPNAVDPDKWSIMESEGYALFVGRLIARKGPHAAADIATRLGMKLVLAGGGVKEKSPGRIVATDGTVIEGNVEHIGSLVGDQRREVFAKAQLFICPTIYIGPWEGVHAESLMSGVPVIAPDYGVFTETLPKELRYRNLKQALKAADIANRTRGEHWREFAIRSFGIDACAQMYAEWFDRLDTLRDGSNGWYSL